MEDQDIVFFYKNEKNKDNESNPCFTCYSRKIPEGLNFTKVKIEEDIYFRFQKCMSKSMTEEILKRNGLVNLSHFMSEGMFRTQKVSVPDIMAILNFTPDSFFTGSRVINNSQIERARGSGCQFLDIGAESTRPGSLEVHSNEEIERLKSAFEMLKDTSNQKISLDSRHYETVSTFIDRIDVINDISGLTDIRLPELALKEKKSYVLMHIRGNPTNMNKMTTYTDLRGEMAKFYFEKLRQISEMGLEPERIIIDPGIGFSKTGEQNLEIIKNPESFNFGFRRLFGHSRKSFLSIYSKNKAEDRLPETIAVSIYLAGKGVEILRVHDPVENINALRYFQLFLTP